MPRMETGEEGENMSGDWLRDAARQRMRETGESYMRARRVLQGDPDEFERMKAKVIALRRERRDREDGLPGLE